MNFGNDMRILEEHGVCTAASVVGLSDLEILCRSDDGVWDTRRVVAPQASLLAEQRPYPITIAVADVDHDAAADVLVFDAAANWLVLAAATDSAHPEPWRERLPEIQTQHFLDVFRIDGQELAFAGNPYGATLLDLEDGATTEVSWGGPGVRSQVSNLAVLEPSSEGRTARIVVQAHERLVTLSKDASGAIREEKRFVQVLKRPYLMPFSGFDGLVALPAPSCGPLFFGLGLFAQAVREIPRNLQFFRLEEEGGVYAPSVIDADLDVQAFGVVEIPGSPEDVLVATIGSRKNTEIVFTLWRIQACVEALQLAEVGAEFDWKTPMQRIHDRLEALPKHRSVKVAARWNGLSETLTLIHYDGFTLREYTAKQEGELWELSQRNQAIHATRDDFAL